MQTFSEQLTAARKAKGMTQEALANAAAVTRQTISSWERGRTIPDIDSVRRLSDVLGVDLSQTAEGQSAAPVDEAAAEVEAQAAPAAAETGKPASRLKKWQIIAGAAALACIVLLLCLLLPRKPAPAGAREVFNAETYTQEVPNEAGKAYITFESRTWTENNGGTDYQCYDFTLIENNGVGFTLSRVDTQFEGKSGGVRDISFTADDLPDRIETDIAPFGRSTIDGGFPKGEFSRLGIDVYGNDANGAPLTFYTLIEF